ncbi:MAG: UDPGP type 1 family protein [Sedimentisphaerales bacterium]|jgi:UDP-N-acetylglucosamine/UDP-N-acetylgalactosamine diphosphorylase
MELEKRYKKCSQLLQKYNQQHLLTFYNRLDKNVQDKLLKQIEELNFKSLDEKISHYVKNPSPVKLPAKIKPAGVYPALPKNAEQKKKYEKAKQLGANLISKGKVAAFIVAGGQGTRLGFDGPKGDFSVSPVKNKTLFQLFAEMIKAAGIKYGFKPKWYIMTSPLNFEQTRKIFKDNNFYGLKAKDIFIFQQGTEVNFSTDGKILLDQKDTLANSPDGHGGSLKALYKSGAIADMKKTGIEYISYFQVDNPLINIFDPLFIGLHAMDKAEMSSKALTKAQQFEKVGNFCLVDGKVTVIEYSDLPKKLAVKKNADSSLVFSLGSTAIHIISRNFVERINVKGFALPYHRAIKKISYVNLQNGRIIKPKKENGIKLETFVFDALPLAKKSIILETIRSQEFAPVKDKSGADNPKVTKRMMIACAANWLREAGVKIPRKSNGSAGCKIEIAPSFAICKEDIAKKKAKIPPIKSGDVIYLE